MRAFFSTGFSISFSKKIALVPPTGNFALEFSTRSLTMNQTKKLKVHMNVVPRNTMNTNGETEN